MIATIGTLEAPSADDLVALGTAIIAAFPEAIRELIEAVPICVQDWADEELLVDLGIEDALDLTGLYRAVPVGDRHAMALPPALPEMIFLYRQPILFEWCQRGCALEEVVFDVLTHEIGHHFGMNEEDVSRMEDARA